MRNAFLKGGDRIKQWLICSIRVLLSFSFNLLFLKEMIPSRESEKLNHTHDS